MSTIRTTRANVIANNPAMAERLYVNQMMANDPTTQATANTCQRPLIRRPANSKTGASRIAMLLNPLRISATLMGYHLFLKN